MKNWTTKEFVEYSQDWDLEDDAGAAVFSDHLIEVGQIRWANMLRWAMPRHEEDRWWPTAKKWIEILTMRIHAKPQNLYTEGLAWDNWYKYAAEHGWPRIPDA